PMWSSIALLMKSVGMFKIMTGEACGSDEVAMLGREDRSGASRGSKKRSATSQMAEHKPAVDDLFSDSIHQHDANDYRQPVGAHFEGNSAQPRKGGEEQPHRQTCQDSNHQGGPSPC